MRRRSGLTLVGTPAELALPHESWLTEVRRIKTHDENKPKQAVSESNEKMFSDDCKGESAADGSNELIKSEKEVVYDDKNELKQAVSESNEKMFSHCCKGESAADGSNELIKSKKEAVVCDDQK